MVGMQWSASHSMCVARCVFQCLARIGTCRLTAVPWAAGIVGMRSASHSMCVAGCVCAFVWHTPVLAWLRLDGLATKATSQRRRLPRLQLKLDGLVSTATARRPRLNGHGPMASTPTVIAKARRLRLPRPRLNGPASTATARRPRLNGQGPMASAPTATTRRPRLPRP